MNDWDVRCGDCGSQRGRPKLKGNRLEKCRDLIIDLYQDGRSATWLAELFAVSPTLMRNALHTWGVQIRRTNLNGAGANHWAWRGGKLRPTAQGYIRIALKSDDPYYSMCETHRHYVLEHRYVMAQALGRPLRNDETIHHINGQKDDNRLENLQLMIGTHHAGVALCCGDCGSQNVVHKDIGS